jgi:cysteinyl-tRNA synthetase
MSKSLGNTLTVHDLRLRYPAEALRWFLLKGHYRQPLDWSDATIDQIVRTLDGLYGTLRDLAEVPVDADAATDEVEAALHDDLNTPKALAALSELATEARRAEGPAAQRARKSALLAGGRLLGLLQQEPAAWFAQSQPQSAVDASKVQDLVDRRHAAKKARDFAQADAIRDQLTAMGIAVEDTPQGPRWKVAGR